MVMQSLSDSVLLKVQNTAEYDFILKGEKEIHLGVLTDLQDQNIQLTITIRATDPFSSCTIHILSLLENSVLKVTARLIAQKGARESLLYLEHTTILKDSKSSVITQPELQIQEDQVKCGHGATITSLSPVTLEYLESRGIQRQKAESMLYSSRINELCEWVLTK